MKRPGGFDGGEARPEPVAPARVPVSNPAPEKQAGGSGGNGHALRSIGHRLAYAFGPEARMTAAGDAGYYRAELRLPVRKGDAAG